MHFKKTLHFLFPSQKYKGVGPSAQMYDKSPPSERKQEETSTSLRLHGKCRLDKTRGRLCSPAAPPCRDCGCLWKAVIKMFRRLGCCSLSVETARLAFIFFFFKTLSALALCSHRSKYKNVCTAQCVSVIPDAVS